MFKISLIILTALIAYGQCDYGSECQTSDKRPGLCMPVKSCKPAYEFFKQISERGGIISVSEREEIQKLHCGTFNNVHHVCCAESNIQFNPDGFGILQNQSCGFYTVDKVTNGQVALLGGYPWMALLIYDDERDPYKCGASLISEQYVLTAAHCIRGKEKILLKVRLGEHQKSTPIDCITLRGKEICSPPHEDIDIEEYILHPRYRSVYHDIALIRLKRKVEIKRNSSDVLMVAVVPQVDVSSCQSQLRPYRFTSSLDERHLCAGGSQLIDTCKGDSGGPLGFNDMYNGRPRFVQYGIVAAGLYDCGSVDVPGIYTNVSHHIQWITDNMRP